MMSDERSESVWSAEATTVEGGDPALIGNNLALSRRHLAPS
jgi:hypothetical protein